MTKTRFGTTESDHSYNSASYFVRKSTTISGTLDATKANLYLNFEAQGNYLTLHLAPASLGTLIEALIGLRRELGLNDDDPTEKEMPCLPSQPAST